MHSVIVSIPENILFEGIQDSMDHAIAYENAENNSLLYVHTYKGHINGEKIELDCIINNSEDGPTIECVLFGINEKKYGEKGKELDRCMKYGSIFQFFELNFLNNLVSFKLELEETA